MTSSGKGSCSEWPEITFFLNCSLTIEKSSSVLAPSRQFFQTEIILFLNMGLGLAYSVSVLQR